jgi:hypothetical protein
MTEEMKTKLLANSVLLNVLLALFFVVSYISIVRTPPPKPCAPTPIPIKTDEPSSKTRVPPPVAVVRKLPKKTPSDNCVSTGDNSPCISGVSGDVVVINGKRIYP